MSWIAPVTLRSPRVTLEPLEQRHCDDLIEAVKDGALWTLWYTSIPEPESMGAEIERRLALQAAGSMLPFSVIDNTIGRAVGMTTYMNIDAVNRRVEIGSTWYEPAAWGGPVNPECKLLLMRHVFETLKFHRVEYKTDARNARSRAAILKLGAKQEGIFRKHMIMADGHVRDSVYCSIIDSDWPAVKAGLEKRLAA